MRGRDGYLFDGYRIRVEFPRSSSRGDHRGGGGGGRGGHMQYGSMSGRASRPKGYQLLVSGLPPTGSWQDVKDHFREAGDIIFADVFRDGTGVVEFSRQDHARRALRDLDDSKFKSHEVCQQKSVKFLALLINSLRVIIVFVVLKLYFSTGRNCLHTSEGSTR